MPCWATIAGTNEIFEPASGPSTIFALTPNAPLNGSVLTDKSIFPFDPSLHKAELPSPTIVIGAGEQPLATSGVVPKMTAE